jgi:hypothetical protein
MRIALRRSRFRSDVAGRPAADTPEAFARAYRRAHPEAGAAALVEAVARWIAARERAIGGGVLDLGLWDERAWYDEAVRAVARAGLARSNGLDRTGPAAQ